MVKLRPLRLTLGVLANDFVLLKKTALLPGHRPTAKSGRLLKLKQENKRVTDLAKCYWGLACKYYKHQCRLSVSSDNGLLRDDSIFG